MLCDQMATDVQLSRERIRSLTERERAELDARTQASRALYERARSSTVVATFMEEFQELLRGMVAIWLTGDRSRRSIKIEAFLASLDGAVLIADPRERAAVVRCAYDAFSERQS